MGCDELSVEEPKEKCVRRGSTDGEEEEEDSDEGESTARLEPLSLGLTHEL